ncbi:hypothetical protein AOPFMNJM_2879 [Methylobacterium jeotgali]|uniref:Uncharacterized protein n=1 Tax=Methylobacterium jeotgali TaxID=381630 RepID=A0ABQ4T028_9HYPH|nr:hypothetical protein AOPFMNJM_2879 [Methylobacterium jeotgali]
MLAQGGLGGERGLEIWLLAVEAAAGAAIGGRGERQAVADTLLRPRARRLLLGEDVVEAGVDVGGDLAVAGVHLGGGPALALAVEIGLERVALGGAFGRPLPRGRFGPLALDPLEQRVALQLGIHVGGEVELGELQELDRLQELRRHHQGLTLAHLQPLQQAHRGLPRTLVKGDPLIGVPARSPQRSPALGTSLAFIFEVGLAPAAAPRQNVLNASRRRRGCCAAGTILAPAGEGRLIPPSPSVSSGRRPWCRR